MDKEKYLKYINDYNLLISLYLNKKEAGVFNLPSEEVSFFYKLSTHHSLRALFYKALEFSKLDVDQAVLAKFEEIYMMNLRKCILFEKEREELYQFLNDSEIEFLPLKGIVIKNCYLDQYTREFADNDIYFKSDDEKIKEFFVNKGYKVVSFRKSNHDVYEKEPVYNFEMHRDLFADQEDKKKFIEYFDNYFDRALVKDKYERALKDEDFYIYFTAHTYKHFTSGGCGLRTLIDYYVFLKNKDLDWEYINEELKKLDLVEFSKLFITLSRKIYEGEILNQEEQDTLLYIASSGTYGLIQHTVERGVKEKGKFGYFMSRVFPPLDFYKQSYSWAYKHKILIPIAWLARFFRIVFKSPKRAKEEFKAIRKADNKEKKGKE